MDNPQFNPDPPSKPGRTAVQLIAHGSRQQAANDDLHELAGRLTAQGVYPIVEASFLELAQPDIATAGARCVRRGATRVLLIPYFLSAGIHLRRDLTAARDELSRRHPDIEFLLGSPLGPHPLLDHLVAIRVRELEGVAESTPGDDRIHHASRSNPEPPFADRSIVLESYADE
jgi:sirohydrochlorin ferrochelatase